jgi:hypothetical protein
MIRSAACLAIAFAGTAHAKAIDLHDFGGRHDGSGPNGPVTVDANGNIFGTTFNGGRRGYQGYGTVFELAAPAQGNAGFTYSIIHNFTGGKDGGLPSSPLTADQQGNIYGTTPDATGAPGGNVFMLTRPGQNGGKWAFHNLYLFQNGADGALGYVGTPLVFAGGALYGVTQSGGTGSQCTGGCGTVFYLTPGRTKGAPWTYHLAYSFPGGAGGSLPENIAGPDANGTLYATTWGGNGLVLALTPDGRGGLTPTTLYSFSGGQDGAAPDDLVLAPDGRLFGTALGGTYKQGSVFQLTPANGVPWTKTILASFRGQFAAPVSLASNAAGVLAGVSFGEIDFGGGRVWTLTPQQSGSYTYRNVGRGTPSRNPENVVYGLGGNLFGVMDGGDSDNGAAFEILQ